MSEGNGNSQQQSRLILPQNNVIDLELKTDIVGGTQVQYNPDAKIVRVMPPEVLGFVPVMLDAPGMGPTMAYAIQRPEILVQLLGAHLNILDALMREVLELRAANLETRGLIMKAQLAAIAGAGEIQVPDEEAAAEEKLG
jgi:hypothetical protein